MSLDVKSLREEFINRIRASKLSPLAEVTLITHFINDNGDPIPPHKTSITPLTQVKVPNDKEMAKSLSNNSLYAASR